MPPVSTVTPSRPDAVRCLSDRLLGMSYGQIKALPQVSEARADIIGAGSLILRLCPGAAAVSPGDGVDPGYSLRPSDGDARRTPLRL